MKVALCVYFNHPYEQNIPVLEDLYGGVFDSIMHIQPLSSSDRPNVQTVYRSSFNFGGFFSDSLSMLRAQQADYYVFVGDDCLLNPRFFGDGFESTFLAGHPDFTAFAPTIDTFARPDMWDDIHRLMALSRFLVSGGLFDQKIENWREVLPDPEPIRQAAIRLGAYSDVFGRPSQRVWNRIPASQKTIVNRYMRDKDQARMPYPMVKSICDLFIVSGAQLEAFCHNVGLLAAMNIFSEIAVPTALLSLPGTVLRAQDLGLDFKWSWGNDPGIHHFIPHTRDELDGFISAMDPNMLFQHPVKLSTLAKSYA